ncbi:ABC transporter ATP-binding protein [Actinophytocola oryzae]|uniref:ABC-type multidrug transport system ATPase subunit n=1 Tax=Actinophytocola oryzae TaxID=502181 RepID=A0A4V3FRC6_9PSEU|nr:ABC transporter ATP-binding protein [Actinophytocola oryzae]TDV43071.1 ABC-type multidrug transport system ATPase subunit [Actinophytocola oryzae]
MRVSDVSKRYGRDRTVLSDVVMDLESGDITAIAGGNGSGKSTLLRILVGVTRPTSGTVTGRPARVGYVPERFPSDERLTARSYLTHMGRIRGLSGREAGRAAERLLDRFALAGGFDTALRRLSKGNLQKVGLAQALVVPPELLVLDEPWSGLDRSAHGVLAEVMAECAANGGTVVFTDHREATVRTNATRVYRIDHGRVRPGDVEAVQATLVVRLVLEAPSGVDGWPRDDVEAVLASAISTRWEGDRVLVRVGKPDADGLLLAALRHGWSVARVDEAVAERITAASDGDAGEVR